MTGIERNEYVTQLSEQEKVKIDLQNESKNGLSNLFSEIIDLGELQSQVDNNPQLKDFLQCTLHKNEKGFCDLLNSKIFKQIS